MTVDFSQIFNDAEIEERESIMAEINSAQELDAMADMIEAKDIETEHEEFIENLRYTAEFSPISETAVDLRFKAIGILQELR